jgi:hypothetical protein
MNNLYSSVVHADVSREDSKNTRDQYVEQLAPKLQQVAGLDLSLQQNVDTAKALFTPFYENKNLVRDIVFTKKYKSEMTKAQRMKESNDEATRKQYWDDGIKKLQYDMQDFVEASSEDMMRTALPQYVNAYDMMGEGLAKIKELDPNVQNVSFSEDGYWKITMKNGSLLTRQPIGENKEGEMQYSNPIGDYLSASLLNDPRAIDYYRTKGYVEARSFYDKNKDQYGDKQAGMNAWGDQFIQQYGTEEQKTIAELEQKEKVLKGRTIGWRNHIKKYGLIEGSNIDQSVKDATAEHEAIKRSKDIRKDRSRKLNEGPSDNLTKAFGMYMSFHMMNDINETANAYASTHGEVDMDANPYKEEDIKQANRLNLEAIKQHNRKEMAIINWELDNTGTESTNRFPTQMSREGDENTSTLLNPDYDPSQRTRNAITVSKQLAEDNFLKLKMVEEWNVRENGINGNTDLSEVEVCYEDNCDGEDYITNLPEIKRALELGDTAPLDKAYKHLKTKYENVLENPSSSPMGQIRGGFLSEMGNNIEYLNTRESQHIRNARLEAESEQEQYDFVVAHDDGSFEKLVEELGISLFKNEPDGSIGILSRAEFRDHFVETMRFDSYTQSGDLRMQQVGLDANDQVRAVMAPYYEPAQQQFTTFDNNEVNVANANPLTNLTNYITGKQQSDISRTVSFNEEAAIEASDEAYDKLIKEMNAVASNSTGHPESFPAHDAATFYDLKEQTGVGDELTPWIGGIYDHFTDAQDNSGYPQTYELMELLLNAKGADMVVKWGSLDQYEGTILPDIKSDPKAETAVSILETHLGLDPEAQGKKGSRAKFKIMYNTNGPIYTGENGEPQRYSVYQIEFEPEYAKTHNQEKTGNTGEKNTAFQKNNHTLSVYVPKGKYPNPADRGRRKHQWEIMLNPMDGGIGERPRVSHPQAGYVEIQNVGDTYWATTYYQLYNPDTHNLEEQAPNTLEVDGVNEYTKFENLKISLEQELARIAAENFAAAELDNKQNK